MSLKESKLNSSLITEYLHRLGEPTGGIVPARAARLQEVFKASSPREHLCTCDAEQGGCGGISDDRLTRCPFCGDGEGECGSPESEQQAVEQIKVARSKAPAGAQSSEALVRPVVEEHDADELDAPELDGEVSPELLKAKLVAAGMTIPERPTVSDLDEAVAAIAVSHRNSVVSAYELGAWLLKARGLRLYLLRTKKGSSAPAYSSWSQFVEAETPFGVRYANKLMATAFAYSRQHVESAGIKTLYILLGVKDPAKRQELAAAAAQGELTASQARAQVRELNGGQQVIRETAVPGSDGFKGKANTEGKKGKNKPADPPAKREVPEEKPQKPGKAPAPQVITLQIAQGKTKVPMWKKGTGKDDGKPAKRLADEPVGELVLANGTTLKLSIVSNPKGQIQIVVEPGRAE